MSGLLGDNPSMETMSPGTIKMANVFTSESDETLKAIGITISLRSEASVNAQVYLLNEDSANPEDGALVSTVSKDDLYGVGFQTIELDDPVALPQGTKYAVVVALNYLDWGAIPGVDEGHTQTAVEIEYGLSKPLVSEVKSDFGMNLGYSAKSFVASAEAGQSYVYGLNGQIGVTPPKWCDITDTEVTDNLKRSMSFNNAMTGEYEQNELVPGNVMIKAFTTYGIDQSYVFPTSITLSPQSIVLATENGTPRQAVFAHLEPQNSDAPLTWSVTPESVAYISDNRGTMATVQAVSEGQATLTVSAPNGVVATANILVDNDYLIADGVDIMTFEPDYFTLIARNVRANPALSQSQPTQVSLYCWSETNQSDINAKNMVQIPGTNDWIYERIPVNDNAVNNYFINADNIKINLYASDDQDNTSMIAADENSWIPQGLYSEKGYAYIAYCQNTGFVHPTVWAGAPSGLIGSPDSAHMEGFRISSGITGLSITSQAYASQSGWLGTVGDGTYCGTMGENRALEAIRLSLQGEAVEQNELTYRVYVKDSGWTDWVSAGSVAGNLGSGKPLQALEVNLNPLA